MNNSPRESRTGGPELSVIIPTLNEENSVDKLIEALDKCLENERWEAVFVDDDSTDRTVARVYAHARKDRRIRCIHRIGRRGLSTACIEGMLSSTAPYLAVIDGDMQHDESLLPKMLAILRDEDVDIVVGSRYLEGGGVGDWDASRANMSRLATRLSRMVVRQELTDPMSGFFMVRSDAFRNAVRRLSGVGFKILLDIFASSPAPLRFRELPYEFRTREAGESKLDNRVAWEFGMLLVDKLIGHLVPVRFVSFTLVGGMGMLVHLAVQTVVFKGMNSSFILSQAVATIVAMTFNFALNNALTYRDMSLAGWDWLRGWFSFSLACSVGAFANVGIASYLFSRDTQWVLAAISGILVGAVWNYAVTMVYTWKKPLNL